MKKKINFLMLALALFANSADAQHWDSLRAGITASVGGGIGTSFVDTIDNYVYVGGQFSYSGTKHTKGIARWNGIQWDSLGRGIDGLSAGSPSTLLAITRYNNKIYAGGAFSSVGNTTAFSIGTWDGANWDSLSITPFKHIYPGAVETMEVIDDELYIGGVFDSINNVPCKAFAKWNDTNWAYIGLPSQIQYTPYVLAICKYNGEIYISGLFESPLYPNDTIQDIMRYDGTNFRSVGGGFHGSVTGAQAMVVYNNELYVAGAFTAAEGNVGNYIQKWNGTTWSAVGGGVNGFGMTGDGTISKLFIHDNKLYAIGKFYYAGGIPAQYVASWDGTNWCGLGSSFDNWVLTGCSYNDTIIVAGGFHNIDGLNRKMVAKWIGGGYTAGCTTNGVEENNLDEEINIYPNPATNEITIETKEKGIIKIYNVLGEMLIETKEKKIDVSGFAKGIYFIEVTTAKGIERKKFVKE